jgi:hypothetical protein
MPTYNINVRTPSHIADTLSVERSDDKALRNEVARFVGQLLHDHAELLWSDEQWQIDVSDKRGLILYVLDISVFKSPATDPRQRAGMPTNDQ